MTLPAEPPEASAEPCAQDDAPTGGDGDSDNDGHEPDNDGHEPDNHGHEPDIDGYEPDSDGHETDSEDAAVATEHRFAVEPAHAGERIDALIAAVVPALSRAAVQRLIEDARVQLDGAAVAKPGQRVRAGQTVAVAIPAPEPVEIIPEDIPLAVMYEDAELIVIDKPAGLVVHPAAGHPRGTLVNALLFHCNDLSGIGGALRPGIVHRLDKDTSGVMVATKTDRAHAALGAAFAAKSRGEPGGILREYLAIAAPPPPGASGTLRTAFGRHPTDRKRFSSRVARGKPAVTHWTIVERLGSGERAAALIQLRLETGRTHQIRVHAADHGWPLLGDPLYGRSPRPLAPIATALGRQALHAARLELVHPVTGAHLAFESPLPADLVAALAALRAA
ncbi:MAG TPA: RluA family pseudouridine synthase [Kofleriaceae bacterium]|nr:RluA family pseudouridine synthase [Kofleriaceae bacterium]